MIMEKKNILIYDDFNNYNVEKIEYLKNIKNLGTNLIIGISKDGNEIETKENRLKIIESCKYVDEVFVEYNRENIEKHINKYAIDILILNNSYH